ncbi:Pogo transposable element-like 46 [Homarus americanus]|uniref:Pogo transposable element-like 46 n=1 Tax=Homarus americanus TaxID=6706 RepID=A0A8J5JY94_HOMAM|nr:Pogo transposable element-like 46 [Homarus americanus]
MDKVKKHLQQNNIVTAGGLTSVLQPLDVSLNKPFKDNIRSEWNKWLVEEEKSFTKGGNMHAPPLDVLCEFVIKSWEAKLIKLLKKCGISNAMDWEEDDFLWRDSDEEEDDNKYPYNEDEVGSPSDSDPYADLFMLDNEQPADFEGF